MNNINIIPINNSRFVNQWMQDLMQFGSINGRPVIYHINYKKETDKRIQNRMACQIGRQCNIHVVAPRELLKDPERCSLVSGGNWEVLPGGTLITGVLMTEEYKYNTSNLVKFGRKTLTKNSNNMVKNVFSNKTLQTFETCNSHMQQIMDFREKKNDILAIDISFLSVGHVDEIFNLVKAKGDSLCNFAILRASPELGYYILRKNYSKNKTTLAEK